MTHLKQEDTQNSWKQTETMISYSYPHPNRPPPLPPSYKESEEGLTIQVNVLSSTFLKDLRCFIWDESARSSKYWQSRSSRCLMKIAPGNQILLHIETKYRANIKFCSVPSIKSMDSLCSVYTFSNLSNIYSIGSRKTNSFQLIPFFWLNIGVSYKPERISYDAKLKCQNCSRPFDNPWCSIEALKVFYIKQNKRTQIQCCHQWTWTSI